MKDVYEAQRRYYAKNRVKVLRKIRKYQKEHIEAVRAYQRAWARVKTATRLSAVKMCCRVCGEMLKYEPGKRRGKYCDGCSRKVYELQHRKAAYKH